MQRHLICFRWSDESLSAAHTGPPFYGIHGNFGSSYKFTIEMGRKCSFSSFREKIIFGWGKMWREKKLSICKSLNIMPFLSKKYCQLYKLSNSLINFCPKDMLTRTVPLRHSPHSSPPHLMTEYLSFWIFLSKHIHYVTYSAKTTRKSMDTIVYLSRAGIVLGTIPALIA